MEMREERSGDLDVLILKGRLDAAVSKEFKKRLSLLVEEGRVRLVMDLSGVDFIDSSGLGLLVGALRGVTKMGGDIKIASPQNPVRAIFELTRLHRVFGIYNDRTSAEKAFGKA